MGNVTIKFNGKDYLLSCDNGQEENLKKLASHLNKKLMNGEMFCVPKQE